jgi:hypothetical protein
LVFILYGGEVAVKEAGKAEFYPKSSRTPRIYCQKRICSSLILLKRNERLIIDAVKRRECFHVEIIGWRISIQTRTKPEIQAEYA